MDDADHRLRRPPDRRPRPASTGPTQGQDRCSATGSAAATAQPIHFPVGPSEAAGRGHRPCSPPDLTPCSVPRFMVLAPEHPLVDQLLHRGWMAGGHQAGVDRRRRDAERGVSPPTASRRYGRSDIDRQDGRAARRPECSPVGVTATNPDHRRTRSPCLIADYVLYGVRHRCDHGRALPVIQRDFDFATPVRLADRRPSVQPPAPWFEAHDDRCFLRHRRLADCVRGSMRRTCKVDRDGLDLTVVGTVADGVRRDQRLARGARLTATPRSTTSCATGCSAGNATGASPSRSSMTRDGRAHSIPESHAAADAARRCRQLLAEVPSIPDDADSSNPESPL